MSTCRADRFQIPRREVNEEEEHTVGQPRPSVSVSVCARQQVSTALFRDSTPVPFWLVCLGRCCCSPGHHGLVRLLLKSTEIDLLCYILANKSTDKFKRTGLVVNNHLASSGGKQRYIPEQFELTCLLRRMLLLVVGIAT